MFNTVNFFTFTVKDPDGNIVNKIISKNYMTDRAGQLCFNKFFNQQAGITGFHLVWMLQNRTPLFDHVSPLASQPWSRVFEENWPESGYMAVRSTAPINWTLTRSTGFTSALIYLTDEEIIAPENGFDIFDAQLFTAQTPNFASIPSGHVVGIEYAFVLAPFGTPFP